MLDRRGFIRGVGFGLWAWATPVSFAEQLTLTPAQTEGPFYPDRLPLDTDNDLIRVNDAVDAAVGEVTHLSGRVMTAAGSPVRGALVEVWQVDHHGVYIHSRAPQREQRDGNFQGFGRFLTASDGRYYFRTIKPVPYSAGGFRTPHIHVIVRRGERKLLTTQMYIKGHPLNARDGIYRSLRDDAQRDNVTIAFDPIKDSKIGELAAEFNIVLGHTPADE
jgi:protocatechuate 3,4-dioxygenase beta subunit